MATETDKVTRNGILVIDPVEHMGSLVATMCRSIGRRDIREANDTHQARVELLRRPFQIIMIDDSIGPVDAVEFVRKLRADKDNQNRLTPIIMMSASPGMARISAARDAGVTEFLRKPFAANHIQTRIDNIEQKPRAFIESATYTGPDRRRRTVDVGGDERRGKPDPQAPSTAS